MANAITIPQPARRAITKLARDLRDARLRRALSAEDMAGRMFVSRNTVWRMEKGDPTVAIGTIATALFILGLHDRLAAAADQAQDAVGLAIDRENLPKRIRHPRESA